MLPGGIHVLGLAIQVSNAELKSSQPHLKHLLTSVWKRSKCVSNNYWVELNGRDHQLLLYFNKESKKYELILLHCLLRHNRMPQILLKFSSAHAANLNDGCGHVFT